MLETVSFATMNHMPWSKFAGMNKKLFPDIVSDASLSDSSLSDTSTDDNHHSPIILTHQQTIWNSIWKTITNITATKRYKYHDVMIMHQLYMNLIAKIIGECKYEQYHDTNVQNWIATFYEYQFKIIYCALTADWINILTAFPPNIMSIWFDIQIFEIAKLHRVYQMYNEMNNEHRYNEIKKLKEKYDEQQQKLLKQMWTKHCQSVAVLCHFKLHRTALNITWDHNQYEDYRTLALGPPEINTPMTAPMCWIRSEQPQQQTFEQMIGIYQKTILFEQMIGIYHVLQCHVHHRYL